MPSSVYTKEYFLSAACEGFDSYVEGRISKVKERELQLLEAPAGAGVLDLGCGRGEVAAELLARGARVVALDYSAAAVELTAERLAGRAPVLRADARRLPFADGTFDRILMGDVIEHLHWPLAVRSLTEAARVLTPSGFLLVHTAPNLWFVRIVMPILRRIIPLLGWRSARNRFAQYDEYRDDMHPNELSPLGLRRLVSAAGLAGKVWVDRDVLRSGQSAWADDIAGSRAWHAVAVVAGAWPFRLLLGNDLYARVRGR